MATWSAHNPFSADRKSLAILKALYGLLVILKLSCNPSSPEPCLPRVFFSSICARLNTRVFLSYVNTLPTFVVSLLALVEFIFKFRLRTHLISLGAPAYVLSPKEAPSSAHSFRLSLRR